MADGEYVWMPYEQARKHRGSKQNDSDMILWWALAFFVGYFILKMVPTILQEHGWLVAPDDSESARRRMESVAGLLAGAKPGDHITAEMAEQLATLLAPHRHR